jgi:uncharacterized protein YegP (UPF0339 family)
MFLKIGSVVAVALAFGAVGCSAADDGSFEDGAAEISSHSARFETFVGNDGKTYFDLVAGNGQNVLRSQGYGSASSAQTGMDSVVANGTNPAAFEILEASDGSYYFNLTAANHEIIATSEMYSSKYNAQRGAATVRALVLMLGENPEVKPAVHQARFEVFTGEDKKFYFHLRAANGEIILVSQAYTAKSSALSGIKSVESNGASASQWKMFSAINGDYGIRLVATNGQTIGSGELYSTQSNATKAISTIESLLAANVPVYQ